MADVATFPTITAEEALIDGITFTFKAGVACKTGQVVAINATGVDFTVNPALAAAGEQVIGVAITDQPTVGGPVNVCVFGICKIQNADDTTAIDAGHPLETNDNTIGGTINEAVITASGATATMHAGYVGRCLTDIAGGGTGYVMVNTGFLVQPNAS